MSSYILDLIVPRYSLALMFVSSSIWKMDVSFHKELRGAILGEQSDLSRAAWHAMCPIRKEFRAECMEG